MVGWFAATAFVAVWVVLGAGSSAYGTTAVYDNERVTAYAGPWFVHDTATNEASGRNCSALAACGEDVCIFGRASSITAVVAVLVTGGAWLLLLRAEHGVFGDARRRVRLHKLGVGFGIAGSAVMMTSFAGVFGAAVTAIEKEGCPLRLSGGSVFAVVGALASFGLVAHFMHTGIASITILPQEAQWIEMRDWRRSVNSPIARVPPPSPHTRPTTVAEDLAAADISGQLD